MQTISTARVNQELTDIGHTAGNEIVALVCYGANGTNATEFANIARLQNSPVAVATDEVEIDVTYNRNGTIRSYNGNSIQNGGRWRVIEPNGTIRDRGTEANASLAEDGAKHARTASDAASSSAAVSQKNAAEASAVATEAVAAAQQARIDANSARGTPAAGAAKKHVAEAEKTAETAKNNATNSTKKAQEDSKAADAAAAAAREAEELARKLRNEANHPI